MKSPIRPSYPEKPSDLGYAGLLDWHLTQGTRPDGHPERLGKPWTNPDFAAQFPAREGSINERTIRNWRKGRSSPPWPNAIEQVLFGGKAHYEVWIADLRAAYGAAKNKTDARATAQPVEIVPQRSKRRPQNLPYPSLGSLFKGRETFLKTLHDALNAAGQAAVVGKALHGLGGVGKTRLAVEYALRFEAAHSAMLFVRADTPELLATSLAALAGPDILDLPEKDAREDHVKIPAALNWLEAHPGWLMILDNVDDAKAAKAVQDLLAKLRGGHVIITGRHTNFSGAVKKLELGVLAVDDAVAFLLERTEGDRDARPDDAALARALANALGGLALGLEQAGAYIAAERIAFARYLKLWREKRETVLGWFDRDLMSYDHDTGLAATWATSVDKLKPDSRRLLERLAFFAPDPIPKSLLDVAVPTDPDFDAAAALAGLYAYSLVSQAEVETGKVTQPGFAVHRLVQDFTRRGMGERHDEALREALAWVDAGFVGHAQDVRTWPVLDPLAPHALALAGNGDAAGIAAPTARFYDTLGSLLQFKARFSQAEPLYRRALAINEGTYGPDHLTVAPHLNNLAFLLSATNRLDEAEPLFRRALAIMEASYGPDHPSTITVRDNLATLLAEPPPPPPEPA